jgi:flagellar motor switch protein FliM
MVFEAKLVYALIDTYFGGIGRATKIESRDFTSTEVHIIQMLLEQVIAGAEEAWEPVLPARVKYLSRESDPHFINLASPTELVTVSRLRIDFDGRGGEFHVTIPYATLEPLKDTLRAGVQSDRADREERWSQLLRNELEDAQVELVTRLGSVRMTVGSLIDMRPGDIIPLDFDGHATVVSDGIALFTGDLGQQRGMQVVRVNEMNLRKSGNSLDAFMRKNP